MSGADLEAKYKDVLRSASKKIKELQGELDALRGGAAVALCSMACRLPGGAAVNDTPERFWEFLRQGGDAVSEIPPGRWDMDAYYSKDQEAPGRSYVRHGAFIDGIREFDHELFNITPREARSIDPQQRLMLQVAWEAFERAGMSIDKIKGSNTGVYVGLGNFDYARAHLYSRFVENIDAYSLTGISGSIAAGRLAFFYGLEGPAMTVDTACSSTLVALALAVRALRAREIDAALVGSASLILIPEYYVGFSKMHALSPTGRSRAFDSSADGYARGEGCGMLVLKRLDDALAGRDPILAVIRGIALNQDGTSNGLTAPNGLAQRRVIRASLRDAGLMPDDIDYVEAHGTGTPLGDPIEAGALADVFGNSHSARRPLYTGSVKSNVGHLEAAAGMPSIIKTVMSIQKGMLPQSLHFKNPNPHIPWDDIPVRVVEGLMPWPEASNGPRRAGISSFGFSGTNAHLILEAPPDAHAQKAAESRPIQLLKLSARHEDSLKKQAARVAEFLEDKSALPLADICYTMAARRANLGNALAVVGADNAAMASALREFAAGAASESYLYGAAAARRTADTSTVFLFDGQGGQYPGMARGLYEHSTVFRKAFDEMGEVYEGLTGRSLNDLVFNSDDKSLSKTENSQPAILCVELALFALWKSWGIRPTEVAGHSLGEYAAACAAGVMCVEDAVRLVVGRARLMGALPTGGAMAAVFSDEQTVLQGIEGYESQVSIAALNAPDVTVISGERVALEAVLERLRSMGRRHRMLNVSHSFHSHLVEPAMQEFSRLLEAVQFKWPEVYMSLNLTGVRLVREGDPNDFWRSYWLKQMRSPVRFHPMLAAMTHKSSRRFLELGGGATLTGLGRRALGEGHTWLHSLARGADDWRSINEALGRMYASGVEPEWEACMGPLASGLAPAPTYVFRPTEHWLPEMDVYQNPERVAVRHETEQEELPDVIIEVEQLGQGVIHAPASAQEVSSALAQVMRNVADIAITEEDFHRSIFELGLDSLMLMRVREFVIKHYGIELEMAKLYGELESIAKLSQYIAANACVTERAPQPVPGEADPEMGVELRGRASAAAQIDKLMADRPRPNIRSMVLARDRFSDEQTALVNRLIDSRTAKSSKSKQYIAAHRPHFADWINSLNFRASMKELLYPVVADVSQGSKITDLDGNEYIDMAMGYGVSFFGNRPEFIVRAIEQQLAKGYELGPQCSLSGEAAALISEFTGLPRVAFTNTGTEAVMAAVRAARATTGRRKIVIFNGAYHGSFDGILAMDHKGVTLPVADGTMPGMVEDVIVLDYGNPETLERISQRAHEIAGVLVEPVQSRRPSLQPAEFLRTLRAITEQSGIALIFDEVITGFRIAPGGAQEHFGVRADLATYGKIVGGGMPIGVLAGSERFMRAIDGGLWDYGDDSSPDSSVMFFAGTFSKHPLAMAASVAALRYLKEKGPSLQRELNHRTSKLAGRLNDIFNQHRVPIRIEHFSSYFKFESYGRYALALLPVEMEIFFQLLLTRGIYTWERRICFMSTAHSDEDIEQIVGAVRSTVQEMKAAGFFPEQVATDGYVEAPAAPAQERVFIISSMKGGDAPYHMTGAALIEGPLDADRLEQAFNLLIERHEILRTSFHAGSEGIVQRVHAKGSFKLERFEIPEGTTLDDAGFEELAQSFIRPFDLGTAPLLRAGLFVATGTDKALLVFDGHHIVVDGFSIEIMTREIGFHYAGQRLEPLGSTFRQYTDKVAQALKDTGRMGRLETFWAERLADAPMDFSLPSDYIRPERLDFAGDSLTFNLSPAELESLRQAAKAGGATLFSLLLTSFVVMLQKMTGRTELLVGVPYDARGQEHQGTVGMFADTLVLRASPELDKPFKSLLREIAAETMRAMDHGGYPFESMVERFQPTRDMGRNPIFTVMFEYDNAETVPASLGQAVLRPVRLGRRASMFDLTLEAIESREGLALSFEFRTALFTRQDAQVWREVMLSVLRHCIRDMTATLGSIGIANGDAVSILTGPSADYPKDSTIHGLFSAQAQRTPNAPACIAGGRMTTYRELDERSDVLARKLVAHAGLRPGDPVGVIGPRDESLLVGMLGAMKAGGAYLPLEPKLPEARIKYLLEDTGCRVVVGAEGKLPVAGIMQIDAHDIAHVDATLPKVAPSSRAYIIHTSGSTGEPKGVVIGHAGFINMILCQIDTFGVTADDRVVQFAVRSFDASLSEVFMALLCGAALVMPDASDIGDVRRFEEFMEANGVIVATIPPVYLGAMDMGRVPTLRTVITAGEPAVIGDARAWSASKQYFNAYGPTETSVCASMMKVAPADLHDKITSVPIGKAVANSTIYILDAALVPVPRGAVGEICVAGPGLAIEYLGREAATAEKFPPNPFGEGCIYRTGDTGRIRSDGTLEFIGRIDDQVKVRGYRIEPAEIERALNSHPSIRAAAVAKKSVEGSDELVAYPVFEAEVTVAELRAHLLRVLPEHMLPTYFVPLKSLPLTTNGKVDRAALPLPEFRTTHGVEAITSIDAPATPIEATILRHWRALLPGREIGLDDDFFSLGGQSLKATLMVSRLGHEDGIALTLTDVFENPTLRALARVAKVGAASAMAEIVPLPESSHYALSHAQKRLWTVDQMAGGSAQYNMFGAFLIKGALDVDVFESAFNALIKRHEALRTTFITVEAAPRQRVNTPTSVLKSIDLTQSGDAMSEAARLVESDWKASFDLGSGPLVRAMLIALPPSADQRQHAFSLNMHHIICDGWSMAVIISELSQAYEALASGGRFDPAPLEIQYRDYASWHNALLAGPAAQRLRGYWMEQLSDIEKHEGLPTDRPRSVSMTSNGEAVEFSLGARARAAMDVLARQENASVFILLVAAVKALIHFDSGQGDIVVGSPTAGRDHPKLEGQIGFYVNTLPLRDRVLDDDSFTGLVSRVRATALGAYEHQLYPFDMMVEDQRLERDPSRHPLFDVMVILQNNARVEPSLPGLAVEPFGSRYIPAKFDLMVDLRDDETLSGLIEYNTDLFDKETVESFASRLATLLTVVSKEPGILLTELEGRLGAGRVIEDDFLNSVTKKLDDDF